MFAYSNRKIEELRIVMNTPTETELRLLGMAIDSVESGWQMQSAARRGFPGEPPSDQQKRRYDALRHDLRSRFEKAIEKIDERVKQTVDEDEK